MDSSDSWLEKYDLIIASYEKADSLLRHELPWIKDVGLLIIDEIHMMNDTGRGPVLEVLITLFKQKIKPQIIGLSATIKNCDELAKWLDAELVKSSFRPVVLYQGIFLENEIEFDKKNKVIVNGAETTDLIKKLLSEKKQIIVFLSTRRNAEAFARNIGSITEKFLTEEEKKELLELSEKVKKALPKHTAQCLKVSDDIKKGSAFDHAGLMTKQKDLIENSFRKGILKVICSTPVLAYGVSLPAQAVIIRDIKRYDISKGADFIPVMDYYQMIGRAGRAGLSKEGEAIIVSKTESEKEELKKRYLNGEPEEIYSKLAVEPVLRMYVLSLIASNFAKKYDDLISFFSKTFYAHQFGNIEIIKSKLEKIKNNLANQGFIEEKNNLLHATQMGKRVSELYLDPESANYIINCLKKAESPSALALLHMICRTTETKCLQFYPKEVDFLNEKLSIDSRELIEDEPSPWDYEYDSYLSAYKTSLLFNDWIEEKNDEYFLDNYHLAPGTLRTMLYNADWLLYSSREIARILGKKELQTPIQKIRLRMKHGIKEELIYLIRFRGIGRIKARKLFNNSIKNIKDIKTVEISKLNKIIGEKTAKKLLEDLNVVKEEDSVNQKHLN